MSKLLHELRDAPSSERAEITQIVFNKMRAGDRAACEDFRELTDQVDASIGVDESGLNQRIIGEFTSKSSAALVTDLPRVKGYLSAIERVASYGSEVRTVIDAGCGSSAILSIGAALSHPRAEVLACEINPRAAHCAREVVRICGLQDRIRVSQTDVTTATLPDAQRAYTETFAAGLFHEQGHKIIEALGRVSEVVLPTFVQLSACDTSGRAVYSEARNVPSELWQPVASINLREPNETVSGELRSSGVGERNIFTCASFYDHLGRPVVARRFANNITSPEYIGTVPVRKPGEVIQFEYKLGSNPFDEDNVKLNTR